MKEIIAAVKKFFAERFSLNEDRAEEHQIVEAIKRDVNFKGTNLWTLIFAILIASIGLNVNSTAVIIGAMLISPLMGPIMGVGLAVATNDFDLLKRGITNVAIASIISILTSALYFSISPIHNANSELLARTNPSLWDVFIAFFGGLAGIVAGTRKAKSNVIPGVAIATALMPPLCTAGFGLATGKLYYLLGALYLFFINSLFICLATFLIVKQLRFHKKEFQTKSIEKRVSRYIWIIVIVTVAPSVYLAYMIVQRTIFEDNAKNFVQKEFHFSKTQVINRSFKIQDKKKDIELLLMGEELSPYMIDSLQKKLTLYGLDSTKLVIRQGLDAKQEIDLAQIKASILEDVFKDQKQKDTVQAKQNKLDLPIPDLRSELKSLYPDMRSYTLFQTIVNNLDSTKQDTISLFTTRFNKRIPRTERTKLQNWVKQRIKTDSVKLLIE
ncbi:MAG: TIGR00341 family protein [Chitinophagaceae bacterium]